MLEESRHDGEAADKGAGCHFGTCPETHSEDVVADIWILYYFPRVGGADYGCCAGTRYTE
jgi:hypothetical protein